MDQQKVGQFLKTLRKEKKLTQEMLAETLKVSSRSVSRWETGSNMPDISLLVELSQFYDISIPELIDGERKSENMNQETKDTAIKMAEYSKHELSFAKQNIINVLFMAFGLFIMISALAIFPNESSWGSIYAILGGTLLLIGIYMKMKVMLLKFSMRIMIMIGCIFILFGAFTVLDYITVTQLHQVPRFSYKKSYGENIVEHQTLFYKVIQRNPGKENEKIEIAQ